MNAAPRLKEGSDVYDAVEEAAPRKQGKIQPLPREAQGEEPLPP
jgi:hypothetical protein